MKTITIALALCCGAGALAQETAFEIAPDLTGGLEQLNPALYQMLSDGTYDAMSTDEREAFVFEHLLQMSNYSREVQLQIELHNERRANGPNLHYDAKREAHRSARLLGLLQMIDSAVTAGARRSVVTDNVGREAQ